MSNTVEDRRSCKDWKVDVCDSCSININLFHEELSIKKGLTQNLLRNLLLHFRLLIELLYSLPLIEGSILLKLWYWCYPKYYQQLKLYLLSDQPKYVVNMITVLFQQLNFLRKFWKTTHLKTQQAFPRNFSIQGLNNPSISIF